MRRDVNYDTFFSLIGSSMLHVTGLWGSYPERDARDTEARSSLGPRTMLHNHPISLPLLASRLE